MNPSTILQWGPAVLVVMLASAITITAIILMIKHYKQVLAGMGSVGKAIHANYQGFVSFARSTLLTRGAFFRYAILVCMSMSVVHGSHLFTTKNNFAPLDLALAATFDIGTWVLMEAMISTRKRGYLGASLGILVSIVIVSGISFLANMAFNAHYYDASQFSGFDLSGLGLNTQDVLIIAQSSPPLIIILMTLVAETFIKADVKEEVSYAQRIWARHQRKIDREEAKLRLAYERARLQQQYNDRAPMKQLTFVPAWSFLGFTMYRKLDANLMGNSQGNSVHVQEEPAVSPIAQETVSSPVSLIEPPRETVGETGYETEEETTNETVLEPEQETEGETTYETEDLPVVSRSSRITRKLSETNLETGAKQERNTDKLFLAAKKNLSVSKNKNTKETDKVAKIRQILKRNKDIDPVELAKKVDVTPQYARRVKVKVLAEMGA